MNTHPYGLPGCVVLPSGHVLVHVKYLTVSVHYVGPHWLSGWHVRPAVVRQPSD